MIEARVDIAGRKLESWNEVKGVHAPVIESEFRELGELVKKDPRVREALAKRGIKDLTTVECVPLPYSYFAIPELDGRRIMYGGCSDLHGAHLSWGRSIEGLYVQVDAVEKKVLKVIDGGPVPVASGPVNFQEAASVARAGTTPLTVMQPNGPGFQISGGEVSWQNWRFRVRLDPRVGAVINLVRFDDGTKLRSVLYEASLSELYVPYMDPAEGWATRMFIDAGEFFHGGVLKQLREGVDCPANATYMDGLVPNERGIPMLRPRLACLYEFSSGNPAWRRSKRRWSAGASQPHARRAQRRGDRKLRLSAGLAVRAGRHRAGRRGRNRNHRDQGSRAEECDATAAHGTNGHASTGSPDEYGQFVAENTVGVNHDHFFRSASIWTWTAGTTRSWCTG